jgi:hypothetical protein
VLHLHRLHAPFQVSVAGLKQNFIAACSLLDSMTVWFYCTTIHKNVPENCFTHADVNFAQNKRRQDSNRSQQWPLDSTGSTLWKKSVLKLCRRTVYSKLNILMCKNQHKLFHSHKEDYKCKLRYKIKCLWYNFNIKTTQQINKWEYWYAGNHIT